MIATIMVLLGASISVYLISSFLYTLLLYLYVVC